MRVARSPRRPGWRAPAVFLRSDSVARIAESARSDVYGFFFQLHVKQRLPSPSQALNELRRLDPGFKWPTPALPDAAEQFGRELVAVLEFLEVGRYVPVHRSTP